MARRFIRPRLSDQAGNVLRGGWLNVFDTGTTNEVSVYAAATGGAPLTQPLVTDARGEVELWLADGTADVDLQWSDSGTVYKGSSSKRVQFASFTEFVSIGTTLGPPLTATINGAYEVDATAATFFILELVGDTTLTLTDVSAGSSLVVQIEQTGAFGLTWPNAVLWPNGVAPTVTQTVGALDLYVVVSEGPGVWVGLTAGTNITSI